MSRREEWVCWVWLVVVVWTGWVAGAGEDEVPLDEEYPGLALDYPVDYQYDDGPYSVYTPHLSNVTMRKCRCGGDQYWDGGQCHNATTFVRLLDPHTGEQLAAHTSDLGEVLVEPLTCPTDHHHLLLDSNINGHHFALLEFGDLYWEPFVFANYCIDHILLPSGQPGAWEAHLCLPPPLLPRCCPPAHTLLPNGNCTPASAVHAFTPPVSLLGKEVVWRDEEEGLVVPVSCPGKEILQRDLGGDVRVVWHPQGTVLRWPSKLNHPEVFHDYCLGVDADGGYVARMCYHDPVAEHWEACRGATCVRKCCPEHQIFLGVQCGTPVDNETMAWQPEFYHKGSLEPGAAPPHDLTIVHGLPLCATYFQMEAHKSDTERYYLLADGTLHVPAFDRDFPAHSYCLDKFVTENGSVHALPLVCFQDNKCKVAQEQAYPVLLGVSCIFLTITLLVYVSVPELHAKVHGKCLVSHVTALLLAYLSLIIVQRTTGTMPDVACKIMASITHVSFLAAFFWLNVMCFDIWWTLKSMRPVAETGERSRFRFKMYSVYSWGCPLLISVLAIVVQVLPEEYDLVRPGFGESKCWFDNKLSMWAYFYGFVLVLVISNIVFFCWVAVILIMAQNDPILQRTRQQNRERMWLYGKLFLVMGLTWITEVISWQEGSCEAWIATDIINALQGFSIFLIFICKRNMIKRIRTNWEPYLRRVKELFGPTRPPPSTRQVVRDTSSFSSSSVHRPSQSNASQRTVQSQISLDPTTASRKLSTTSLGSVAGAPVHALTSLGSTGTPVHFSNSLSMDTITEATHQEGEEEAESNQEEVEKGQRPERESVSEPVASTPVAQRGLGAEQISMQAADSRMQRQPGGAEETEAAGLNGRVSPSHVEIDISCDPPDQEENSQETQESKEKTGPQLDKESELPLGMAENGAVKTVEEEGPFTSNGVVKNGEEESAVASKGVVKTGEGEGPAANNGEGNNPVASKGAVGTYNLAFTTEHDYDQPIEV